MLKQKKFRFKNYKPNSSAGISPHNIETTSSRRIYSPNNIKKANLNLQIPLHKTPSPKSINSSLK